MISSEQLMEQKLGAIKNLPTLPMVLRQIQKALRDPKINIHQIAMIVAKDQALASRVIRLINSAFYGVREHVTSVTEAIVMLGLYTLNHLMIGLSVVKLFKNSQLRGLDADKFWEHCFATALIARRIAQLKNCKDPDHFFIAGLVHDMGRLALDQFLHEDFSKALEISRQSEQPLVECESKAIGFNHCDAGAWLGNKWDFPEPLIASIAFHHGRTASPTLDADVRSILETVSSANQLCNNAAIGSSGDDCRRPALRPALPCCVDGVSGAQMEEIINTTRSEVKRVIDEWTKA